MRRRGTQWSQNPLLTEHPRISCGSCHLQFTQAAAVQIMRTVSGAVASCKCKAHHFFVQRATSSSQFSLYLEHIRQPQVDIISTYALSERRAETFLENTTSAKGWIVSTSSIGKLAPWTRHFDSSTPHYRPSPQLVNSPEIHPLELKSCT